MPGSPRRTEKNGLWFIYGPSGMCLTLGTDNARKGFGKVVKHHLDWPNSDWVTDRAMVIRPTVIPVKEKVCTLEPFFED